MDEVDATIGLDRLRALHVNDSATPLGSNRDRHADVLEGEMGKGLGVFLAHPAFQGLAAYLETPGTDGHGPVKADLTRVRRLYAHGRSQGARLAHRRLGLDREQRHLSSGSGRSR